MAKQTINRNIVTPEELQDIITNKHTEIYDMINRFLATKQLDVVALPALKVKQLELIAASIFYRQQKASEAEKRLKELQITIQNVSADSNISRKTFYNNEILQGFVESYIESDDTLKDEIKKLKERIAELNSQIEKMVARDVDFENLNLENCRLQRDIEYRDTLINNLKEQNTALVDKNTKLQVQHSTNIIQLNNPKE